MSKKIVKINGYDVSKALGYVWGGHYIFYVIEDNSDKKEAFDLFGDKPRPLTDAMFRDFLNSNPYRETQYSRPVRFILNWKLTEYIVDHETADAEFEFEDGTIGVYDADAEYSRR